MGAITVAPCRIQYPYVENVLDYGSPRRMYADTSKNEVTWYRVLWHYNAEDRGTTADSPKIAQASRDGDIDGILYIGPEPRRQPQRPVPLRER